MIQANALIDKFKYALDNKWGYIWGAAGILWTEARQKQKVNYMVNQYGATWQKDSEAKQDTYYYAAMYGSKWVGHYVADCSGLFAWAYKQLGSAIAHGSNSIYNGYCSSKGKLNDDLKKTLIPGTAVFTGDSKSHGHIGLYVGSGKVIEASGTQAGVCVSNITAGKWTYFGLLKDVSYGDTAPATEPAKDDGSLPTLRRGSKGAYVTKAQTLLKERGYDLGPCGIDGDYGPATEKAIRAFQKDWGLEQDGVTGPRTWELLTTAPVKEKTYTVTIPGLDLTKAKALLNSYPKATMKEE